MLRLPVSRYRHRMTGIGCPGDLIVTTVRDAPGELSVRVLGELDFRTAPVLSAAVRAATGARRAGLVRLDLGGLSFCDHAGLRALHALGAAAGVDGVRIVAAHRAVDLLLRVCGIETFLGYRPSAERPTPAVRVRPPA